MPSVEVMCSRYWWKAWSDSGILAFRSGRPSTAISCRVCRSPSLLASWSRSHVTEGRDSSPAAHRARLHSSVPWGSFCVTYLGETVCPGVCQMKRSLWLLLDHLGPEWDHSPPWEIRLWRANSELCRLHNHYGGCATLQTLPRSNPRLHPTT